MNSVNPNFSVESFNGYSVIKAKGLENSSLKVKSIKINKLTLFSRFKISIIKSLSSKKFIELTNNEKEKILVKVSDLSKASGISKKIIVRFNKSNSLNELIMMKLEAKNYKVRLSVIAEYKREGKSDRLHYLEYLAESLELPLLELIKADKQGDLEDFLHVEQRCYATFKKLDKLYGEEKDTIKTRIIEKDKDAIKSVMTPDDLKAIKNVVRSAYKVLLKNPVGPETTVEKVIVGSKHYHILVKSTQDSLKITTLFGKCIGSGTFGAVVRPIDLLNGEWATDDEAVLKIPNKFDENSKQILQESKIIDKIHGDQQVLGIQKKLKVIKNVLNQVVYHQGCLYDTDLFNVLLKPDSNIVLRKEDKASMTYQILHGVCHMHSKGITHLDLKPKNIFCNFTQDEIGPRVFIADFGGAVDHSPEGSLSEPTYAKNYSLKQDRELSDQAFKENNRALYQKIQKKMDVFSTCSVICSIFTNEMPYQTPFRGKDNLKEVIEEVNLKDNLQQQLADAGLSPETIKLLAQGLEADYEKRPDARTLFEAIQKDMEIIAPQQLALLIEQSWPLS